MKNLVNKLALGTVQLGLDYGINNINGKPSKQKSLEIIDFARRKGIKVFDTAFAYGNAEELLGESKLEEGIKIITKLRPNIISENKGAVDDIITANLRESLDRLKRNCVDGFLLHTPEYVREDKIISSLCDLKKQGLVKNIGVSVYEETDALYAVKLKEIDYIQIPYNIFDQRLIRTDFFRLAKKNKVTVFARSAFLQGLFFMPENKIPPYLNKSKRYFRDLDEIINRHGLTRLQAALMFSLNNDGIDFTVFGVDNIDQLAQNIILSEQSDSCRECVEELKNKFVGMEKNIIFPSLWKK